MATATASPTNPVCVQHALNRQRFAQDMANAIWAAATPVQRRDLDVEKIGSWSDDVRLKVAKRTGRDRMPSEGTWSETVRCLRIMVAAIRGEA